MNRYYSKPLIILLLFSIFNGCSSCNNTVNFDRIVPDDFVSIKGNQFYLNGNEFYPLALNYMVSMQTDCLSIWPSPHVGYHLDLKFHETDKDSTLTALMADFQLIKKMGFNTIRVVGIGEQSIDNKETGEMSINARYFNQNDVCYHFADKKSYDMYFDAIDQLVNVADSAGLKVILLLRTFSEVPATEKHLSSITGHFKDNSTIMAFDLFNEPLYFDSLSRKKEDVHEITSRWRKLVLESSPNHLTTIGMTGIREVFEWDPNMVNVDFLSFHPYEYEPDQVRNELYWYHKYVKIPWMIGETGITADGDSVSYDVQVKFAEQTLKQTINCGSLGYSWWQYRDVDWNYFHSDYMGLITQFGETIAPNGFNVHGTIKPTAEIFMSNLVNEEADGQCLCLDNYYNYSNGRTFRLKGVLVDDDGNPIDGGVILAWNEWWTKSYHTVTKSDGSFELMGTFPFYHWMASSTLHSVIRNDVDPANAKLSDDNIPYIDLGKLELEALDY